MSESGVLYYECGNVMYVDRYWEMESKKSGGYEEEDEKRCIDK